MFCYEARCPTKFTVFSAWCMRILYINTGTKPACPLLRRYALGCQKMGHNTCLLVPDGLGKTWKCTWIQGTLGRSCHRSYGISRILSSTNVKRYILILLIIRPKLAFLTQWKINGIWKTYPIYVEIALCTIPLQPSHSPCSSMLSTRPWCAQDMWWLPTTSEVSRQLYGVTRSDTYGHVAV
jgi:hypothetical protein